MYKFTPVLPEVSRDPDDIDRFAGAKLLGNDLEWSQYQHPTVLGLSDGDRTVSVPWVDGVDRFKQLVRDPETLWVGHNIVAADLIVLRRLGIDLPLDRIEDTIIWFWLTNMHLAKAPNKSALQEDEGERRGRGFYNLGTLLSIYTDIWHYKDCRGSECTGPCPDHAPFEYNGIDALGPVQALGPLKRQARLRGVDKLYPMHRELAFVLAQMQEFGVRIDVPYVYGRDRHPLGSTDGQSLDEQFRREREEIAGRLPFNPASPKQVVAWFGDHGIVLSDAQEATIAEAVDDLDERAPQELIDLLDYKTLGNGVDRWYEPEYRDSRGWVLGYLDDRGYIHPRTASFTSSGRLMQSGPNLQNAGKRRQLRIGKVRKAVIAPEGWYIVRADLSNAEGRTVLYYGGYTEVPDDVHTWMVKNIGLTEDEPFAKALGGARAAAKSVVHASNYLEGLQLKSREALRTKRVRSEVDAGARIVFPDWTFRGEVVTFTGVNLAQRVFGSATFENRKRALDVMTRYIDQGFPGIRDFHKRVTKELERDHCVRTPHGYMKLSYDPNHNDELKTAVSIWGSQTTAHLNKLAILDCWRKFEAGRPMRPVLPVHDELLCYVRDDVPPAEAMSWIKESMEIDLPELPGLRIPADPSYGPSWAEQQK